MRKGARTREFVGVISDTHGVVRPQALAALRGATLLLHAGDIGGPEVLASLAEVAPVVAVRGNNDTDPWAQELPESHTVTLRGHRLHMLHDVKTLDVDPAAAELDAVIAGHSHRPGLDWREGVLFLNPGSAGPRRFRLPVSVARIYVAGRIEAELIELPV